MSHFSSRMYQTDRTMSLDTFIGKADSRSMLAIRLDANAVIERSVSLSSSSSGSSTPIVEFPGKFLVSGRNTPTDVSVLTLLYANAGCSFVQYTLYRNLRDFIFLRNGMAIVFRGIVNRLLLHSDAFVEITVCVCVH